VAVNGKFRVAICVDDAGGEYGCDGGWAADGVASIQPEDDRMVVVF
jgi:hypothetical protein